ncbi:MAG TPA: oxidoreductase, partial [Rhodoglobus sp.]|nr:oxidoreductase [Rhodoglobus sp.]
MRLQLDRLTGTLTMYKLVIVCLAAIGVIALVPAFLGQLGGIQPLALLASAAVAIVATNASSVAIARMLRVTPHLDSAMITALLVFFVMDPRFDLVGLLSIALAGMIASASKYLIAVRGRHILNPAVVGVFAVTIIAFAGVADFSYARWWVGTPSLLLPVAIAAFLILYRTQRLAMGAVFLAVTLGVVVVRYALSGTPVDQAVADTLLSGPAVFFVGFILSEPLTLPPRRWQAMLEAVLVALLMNVPFRVGIVGNSPHLALLAGNVLAFAFGQRRGIRLTYLGKRQLSDTTWELSFQPDRPVRFSPGQYMELTI